MYFGSLHLKQYGPRSDCPLRSLPFCFWGDETDVFFFIHFLDKRYPLKSRLDIGKFCHLMIIFANSLDPDQDRQNVGPDLDPNCLTLRLMVFMKEFFCEKVSFEKKSADNNKFSMKN